MSHITAQATISSKLINGPLQLKDGTLYQKDGKVYLKTRSVNIADKQETMNSQGKTSMSLGSDERTTHGLLEKLMTYNYGQMLLRRRESLLEKIYTEWEANRQIRHFVLFSLLFSAIYGGLIGLYAGSFQILASAVKIPLILFGTILLCQPALYVFNVLAGSELSFRQTLLVLLASTYLLSILLVSLSPVLLLFMLSAASSHSMTLLTLFIFVVAGGAALDFIWKGMKYLAERSGSRPNSGLIKIWSLFYVIMGTQLAWGLRPLIGQKGEFVLFQATESNFFLAAFNLFKDLVLSVL